MAKGYFAQQMDLLDSPQARVRSRGVVKVGREVDFSHMRPRPDARRHAFKIICLECSRCFQTSSNVPSCPGCGGSDTELQ